MASRSVMPPNIDTDGRAFGGMIRIRNAVEAIIIVFILFVFYKIFLFPFSIIVKYAIILALGVPLVTLAIVGIGDLSLTEWYMDRKSFKRGQAIYPFKIPEKAEEKKKGLFFRNKKEK